MLHGIVVDIAEICAVAAIQSTRHRRYQSQHMTVIAGWHIVDIPIVVAWFELYADSYVVCFSLREYRAN